MVYLILFCLNQAPEKPEETEAKPAEVTAVPRPVAPEIKPADGAIPPPPPPVKAKVRNKIEV